MPGPLRVLVTGGAGFIGSSLVDHWLARPVGHRIVVLDSLSTGGRPENLEPHTSDPRCRLVVADVRETDRVAALLHEEALDLVVHLAAETHVDRSIHTPIDFVSSNVVGTASLLEAARSVWLQGGVRRHRVHLVSTDEVFGSLGDDEPPVDESAPYKPRSPYAASKAAADHLACAYRETYGLALSISHACNTYGPRQDAEKLIPRCIERLLGGHPIPVYGDGRNQRDWMHVDDHCRAIDLMIAQGLEGRTFNVSAGAPVPNLEVVSRLCALVDSAFAESDDLRAAHPRALPARGRRCEEAIQFVADRPGHDRRYAMNADALARATGFRPAIDLESGLRRTLDWYLRHSSWLLERDREF